MPARTIEQMTISPSSRHAPPQASKTDSAFGESVDPFRLDRVYALDERLTRQFGKTLAMLIRLREMQAPPAAR